MSKLLDAFQVFQSGMSVANQVSLKRGQLAANVLVPLLTYAAILGKDYGYDLHLDTETILAFSTLLVWLLNHFFTVSSTTKIGLFGGSVECLGQDTTRVRETPDAGTPNASGTAPAEMQSSSSPNQETSEPNGTGDKNGAGGA